MNTQNPSKPTPPTIVLITHRHDLREYATKYFQEKGYRLALPEHRQDVPEVVQREHPPVVVLDLYVSEPSGVDVLHRLRAEGYGEKVIVLAGRSSRALLPKVYKLGVDQVLAGPAQIGEGFDLAPLESAVRHALARP